MIIAFGAEINSFTVATCLFQDLDEIYHLPLISTLFQTVDAVPDKTK